MKGTKKQIAWAKDIRKKVKNSMDIMISSFTMDGTDAGEAKVLAEKLIANMDNESAGNIIDDFKNIKFEKIVDSVQKANGGYWVSKEAKAKYVTCEAARYERENEDAAARNCKYIKDALIKARKAGRNYLK